MAGRQAKLLTDDHIRNLLVFAATTRYPERNRVIVLLSIKGGLRAGEIANLTWEMVLDPTRAVGPAIEVHDGAAKKGSGRRIPLHPELRLALIVWQAESGGTGAVVRSERGGQMSSISIVNWFGPEWRSWVGVVYFSSASGRNPPVRIPPRPSRHLSNQSEAKIVFAVSTMLSM